jgi:hypothetical protein
MLLDDQGDVRLAQVCAARHGEVATKPSRRACGGSVNTLLGFRNFCTTIHGPAHRFAIKQALGVGPRSDAKVTEAGALLSASEPLNAHFRSASEPHHPNDTQPADHRAPAFS